MLLTIDIDAGSLAAIKAAGQMVTLVRSVDPLVEAAAPMSLAIAWQVFAPQGVSTVSWGEDYYAFATTTPIGFGAVVAMNSTSAQPVPLGDLAVFQGGTFTQQSGTDGLYAVQNLSSSVSGFGFAQRATVNGASTLSPIGASSVLINQTLYMPPVTCCQVFLSSAQQDGEVVLAPQSALSISASNTQATIAYNGQTGQFYLTG